tara:strand:+ start:392 stop:586 length:195 start_codon:yes stop_codon:yes gene_type:complete
MIDINKLPKFILTQDVKTRLNPVSGAWIAIICNSHTHQYWQFKEEEWSCMRFNAEQPIIIGDIK